jgi:hypothetical protein
MTEQDLVVMLRKRYPIPAWAMLTQVRNSTGFARRVRTADALVMALFPSRGLELHGFEIKCSRVDWMSELNNPAKAESIQRYCDRWWLVVADKKIVGKGELPPTWGLLLPRGRVLKAEVAAPKLKPIQIDRLFLAALLRKVTEDAIPRDELSARVKDLQQDWKEKNKQSRDYDLEHAKRDAAQWKKAVEEFEAKSGLHINEWTAGNIGAAVQILMSGGKEQFERDLRGIQQQLEVLLKNVTKVLDHA